MAMAVGSNSQAQINVTPMIDILLVMLVIFMVITPIAPKGLPAHVAQPANDVDVVAPPPDTAIVISLARNGTISLNQEQVAEADLSARLHRIAEFRGNPIIFVRGDGELDFGAVAHLIDVARGAGLTRLALETSGHA